jgi:hypothetical protein
LVTEIEDLNERKAAVAATVADMTTQITGLTAELGDVGDAASGQARTMVSQVHLLIASARTWYSLSQRFLQALFM